MDIDTDPERANALESYKKKLLELREIESKLKNLRMDIKGLQRDFETTEDNIKALQSVGQIIGEVLKQLDEERCQQTDDCLDAYVLILYSSHRQSFFRPEIRGRLPFEG